MIRKFFGNLMGRAGVGIGRGRLQVFGMAALLLVGGLLLASCASLFGPRYIVPEEPSAREQMRIAERQLSDARTTFDEDLRREETRKAIAAFRAVVERFPRDTDFTPLAHYYWASLSQEIGEYRRAERVYRDALRLYPNDDVVNAFSLFGLAETLQELNRRQESLDTYRELIDVYAQSDDPQIRQRVQVARSRAGRVM